MNRPTYERPAIVRHQMGLMNKFGRMDTVKPLTHVDGVAIDALVAEHGSPLFVFSQRTLITIAASASPRAAASFTESRSASGIAATTFPGCVHGNAAITMSSTG